MTTTSFISDRLLEGHTGIAIDGAWREGGAGERFDVLDPATENAVASVASATTGDATAAIGAAQRAQPAWAALAPRQRSEVLYAVFESIRAHADAIAELIVRENGKPIAEARGEAVYGAEFFRWFAEESVRLDGTLGTTPGGANRVLVVHQPIGIALLVTPWNFPLAMAARKIAPALAAGCAVVLKPASETPLTALVLQALMDEAGVPPGVVNTLPTTDNASVVSAGLADARVRKLSFTGSTEVGKLLLEQASRRVVNCSMELGGNAPFLVFADADMEAAVEGAMIAKMRHNGETCTAANRFFVEAPVADEFARRLASAMSALRVGNGLDPAVRVGPLIDAAAQDKVSRLVAGARAAGARALTGGERPDGSGFFYPPTVLDRVDPRAEILRQEIFGPVAPIVTFETLDEAVDAANDTEHGLVSYVFTRDMAKGLRVAEAIESGMVGLNKGIVSDPAAPFGGVKQSGIGREGGHEGMLEFTETKYIAVSW